MSGICFLISACPAGHRFDETTGNCEICAKGTYIGHTIFSCLNCPWGTTTAEEGQISIDACGKYKKTLNTKTWWSS